jgi:glycosyltransferase involved in cell wall biosynthesis
VAHTVWITWEDQVRNKSLSARLGAELHVVLSRRRRLPRYVACSWRSLLIVWRHRPSVVIAQNPSIVLTCLMVLLKPLFKYALAIDAHYVGVVAPGGSRLLQRALDFCNARADLVIVTNEAHKRLVDALGGHALVCEDPLPEIGQYASATEESSKDVLFICSFDLDEPYADVFRAAGLLQPDGYVFWVSGNYRRVGIDPADWPHVRFMGYVPEDEFYGRLARSQVVVDLTTYDNCLVCGAYEAMALEKPLVTSKTRALQGYFDGVAVFVDHSPMAIAEGVRRAYETMGELRRRMRDWRERVSADNTRKIEAIRVFLTLPDAKTQH